MSDWRAIARHIGTTTGEPFRPGPPRQEGGGCINTTLRLGDGARDFFIKLNGARHLPMFEAEAEGLAELDRTAAIRVPHPICHGTTGGQSYLVLEHIELRGSGNARAAGRRLARLHHSTQERFGWHRDNTIGSTPQRNTPQRDWITFWREQRLGFQLDLAERNGFTGRALQRGRLLLELFPALIDHQPRPSLIHGDLWGGNLAYDTRGGPVIYDPATYYGDREAELAMTELFGGLGRDFYHAYQEVWPLAPGYSTRKILYNLYHILNHVNLFGGGYAGQAASMIERLLAELGQ